ncbi:Cysteinyl-tRNA synthetase [Candidatus Syntrophocurvum alkaliphilum]|uniref:Cysteine--tRNA ligase n=2 Tax=Candidatus Syntrophocurvum alkaliphilum TaxID=2293317 RepID=A0A6I6DDX5_9FIRM|nr:Cysteinyl-tRNA synthetase [Candidatus Syntrophocurvum alkaliphilum]
MYVCGPTTYNYIHLGNARPLVVFDTLRRYLEYKGKNVTYIQNFTDVDDKILNRANEEGAEPLTLAEVYIDEYFKDADALGIKRANYHPRVSDHIEDIVEAISKLIEKNYAYEIDGDVYFRVKNFKEYGKLSGRTLDEMMAGTRVEVDERKEETFDFALWKKAKADELSWNSPWGKGRPGWHIECSVMAAKYLGETFDIHGGGSDLIFPHHENEIAQSEALTGKPFVNYWMHNGFITVNKEKMSKSLGNFFILREILDKYPADVVRFYLISTHYRSPLDFDDGKLEEARKALNRLKTTITLLDEFVNDDISGNTELDEESKAFIQEVEGLKDNFINAMDDDLNTAKALGYLFEMSHSINSFIAKADKNDKSKQSVAKKAYITYTEMGSVLNIFIKSEKTDSNIDSIIEVLLDLRQLARKEKDYALSDSIRDFLSQNGVKIEDTSEKTRFRLEENINEQDILDYVVNLRTEFKQKKQYQMADFIREGLKEKGLIIEDTREGVRIKLANL